jgi:hypothetical protein
MFATAAAFVMRNKWVQYALLALAVLAAYGAWAAHQRNIGKAEGVEQQKSVEVEQVGKDVKQDAVAFNSELVESHKREAEAQNRATIAQSQAIASLALAKQLQDQMDAAKRLVASTSDDNLHTLTIAKLNLRAPGEVNACYTAREERLIAEDVQQAPLCSQKQSQNEQVIQQQNEAVNKLVDRINILLDRDSKQTAYNQKLIRTIVTLYNAHPPKKRALKCLNLWKCGTGKLDSTELESLTKEE